MKPLLAALRRIPPSSVSLLVAVSFVAAVALFNQYRQVFEIDPDESNNLIKALLLDRGASFGDELWSDQPPLFTYLLAGLFRVVGLDVDAARLLVLLFSGLIVFAVADIARMLGGPLHAVAGVLLLLGSASYLPLSVSVMIGLPAIALALLSVWALIQADLRSGGEGRAALGAPAQLGGRAGLGWYFASGAAFGASLGVKLFTGFVGLPLVAGLWLAELGRASRARRAAGSPEGLRARLRAWIPDKSGWGRLLAVNAAWASGLVLLLSLAFLPFLQAGTTGGLVETHVELREARASFLGSAQTVLLFIQEDSILYGFALVGAALAFVRGKGWTHLLSAWLLLGAVVLAGHYPVWPHHRLLLSVPAAALAGIAAGELARALGRWFGRSGSTRARWVAWIVSAGLALAPGAAVLALSEARVEQLLRPPSWSNSKEDWKIHRAFSSWAGAAHLVIVSRPMFAFRSGKPVPPELAVTSWKRFRTGQLKPTEVLREIREHKPEVVLLSSRWPSPVRNAARKELRKSYRLEKSFTHQVTELWVLQGTTAPSAAPGDASTRARVDSEAARARARRAKRPPVGAAEKTSPAAGAPPASGTSLAPGAPPTTNTPPAGGGE